MKRTKKNLKTLSISQRDAHRLNELVLKYSREAFLLRSDKLSMIAPQDCPICLNDILKKSKVNTNYDEKIYIGFCQIYAFTNYLPLIKTTCHSIVKKSKNHNNVLIHIIEGKALFYFLQAYFSHLATKEKNIPGWLVDIFDSLLLTLTKSSGPSQTSITEYDLKMNYDKNYTPDEKTSSKVENHREGLEELESVHQRDVPNSLINKTSKRHYVDPDDISFPKIEVKNNKIMITFAI